MVFKLPPQQNYEDLRQNLSLRVGKTGVPIANYVQGNVRINLHSLIEDEIFAELATAQYPASAETARQVLQFIADLHKQAGKNLEDRILNIISSQTDYSSQRALQHGELYDALGLDTKLRVALETLQSGRIPSLISGRILRLIEDKEPVVGKEIRPVTTYQEMHPPKPELIVPEAARPGYHKAMLSDEMLRGLGVIDDQGQRLPDVVDDRVNALRRNLWTVARENGVAGKFQINQWVSDLSKLLGHSTGDDKSPSL